MTEAQAAVVAMNERCLDMSARLASNTQAAQNDLTAALEGHGLEIAALRAEITSERTTSSRLMGDNEALVLQVETLTRQIEQLTSADDDDDQCEFTDGFATPMPGGHHHLPKPPSPPVTPAVSSAAAGAAVEGRSVADQQREAIQRSAEKIRRIIATDLDATDDPSAGVVPDPSASDSPTRALAQAAARAYHVGEERFAAINEREEEHEAWSAGQEAASRVDYGTHADLVGAMASLFPGTASGSRIQVAQQCHVVLRGIRPGLYETYEEVKGEVIGVKTSEYLKFVGPRALAQALACWRERLASDPRSSRPIEALPLGYRRLAEFPSSASRVAAPEVLAAATPAARVVPITFTAASPISDETSVTMAAIQARHATGASPRGGPDDNPGRARGQSDYLHEITRAGVRPKSTEGDESGDPASGLLTPADRHAAAAERQAIATERDTQVKLEIYRDEARARAEATRDSTDKKLRETPSADCAEFKLRRLIANNCSGDYTPPVAAREASAAVPSIAASDDDGHGGASKTVDEDTTSPVVTTRWFHVVKARLSKPSLRRTTYKLNFDVDNYLLSKTCRAEFGRDGISPELFPVARLTAADCDELDLITSAHTVKANARTTGGRPFVPITLAEFESQVGLMADWVRATLSQDIAVALITLARFLVELVQEDEEGQWYLDDVILIFVDCLDHLTTKIQGSVTHLRELIASTSSAIGSNINPSFANVQKAALTP